MERAELRAARGEVLEETVRADGRLEVRLEAFSGTLILPVGVTLRASSEGDAAGAAGPAAGPAVSPAQSPAARSAASDDETYATVEAASTASRSPERLAAGKTERCSGPEPAPRWGATFTKVANNKAILYGGEGAGEQGLLSDVMFLSTDSLRWKSPAGCEGKPLAWHSATFLPASGHMLVLGGLGAEGETDEANVFDCDINLWYPLTTSGLGPSPRLGHSACLIRSTLFVMGGRSGRRDLHDLFALDTRNWRWTRPDAAGKAPKARSFHQAVAVGDDRMVVIGGRAGDNVLDDVHVLTVPRSRDGQVACQWSTPMLTGAYFRPRCGHLALALPSALAKVDEPAAAGGDQVLVFGGWDPKTTATQEDAFVLDLGKSHWFEASSLHPSLARRLVHTSGAGCLVTEQPGDGSVIVFGGQTFAEPEEDERELCNDLQVLPLGAQCDSEQPAEASSPSPSMKRRRAAPSDSVGSASDLHDESNRTLNTVTPTRGERKTATASSAGKERLKTSLLAGGKAGTPTSASSGKRRRRTRLDAERVPILDLMNL